MSGGVAEQFDVVIVGAGIAGSALASVLAPAGLSVLVLERLSEYRDQVRGEYLQPWGAAEMLEMGLADVLETAGGGWLRSIVGYGEDTSPALAESSPVPLDALRADSPGGFSVGHPQASEGLSCAAEQRGAMLRRGVTVLDVAAGRSPRVRYEHRGSLREASCRLIVGADGRHSGVRQQLRIQLDTVHRDAMLGGLLVSAVDWPTDTAIIGVEGEQCFLAFPRPGGYVRLYSCRRRSDRATSSDRAEHLRDGFRLRSVPNSERLATADIAGPCAWVRGSDSWTATPAVAGAVLIGDAAGWNDPIIGCGLSIALRDARTVAGIMLASDQWSPAAFAPYVEERSERMRRLRACAHLSTELNCTFTAQGRARRVAFGERTATDPLVRGLRTAALLGPEMAPAESFSDHVMERALAPA